MSEPSQSVIVSGAFDNLRSRQVRLLEEAAKLGSLTVLVWPDELVRSQIGESPKLPLAERVYFLKAIRYVSCVLAADGLGDGNRLPVLEKPSPRIWVDEESSVSGVRKKFCEENGMKYHVLPAAQMEGFPESTPEVLASTNEKVVVTGCYDYFHSGHVRFFEEASAYGDLYVVVGHDANLRLLKGAGHPLFPSAERRYLCSSVKYVKSALISSGDGWLDADPEIRRLKPEVYIVNEDGDTGGKREYCEKLGIEYRVLKRLPAPGLQGRRSTDLRRSYYGQQRSYAQARHSQSPN
jgi:cytidyltransferase-like protein